MHTADKIAQDHIDSPFSLQNDKAYLAWREEKLDNYSRFLQAQPVTISDLSNPTESERRKLGDSCRKTNLVLYESDAENTDPAAVRAQLRSFAECMGLRIAERHRSAGEMGIVALQVSNAERQRGYIPYTRRPINWHTDGYYNGPDERIRAMVLHCVRPAEDGGVNQLLDPEIAYIRLRDRDPAHIKALMHPEAMTIPENREPDGTLRPVSIGPVFSIDPDGSLVMRYTARTRSISWRDTPETAAAVRALTEILNGDDPMMLTVRMKAGQGVLCNNVLHNRTGFDPDASAESHRLLFRVRFHNRVKGS